MAIGKMCPYCGTQKGILVSNKAHGKGIYTNNYKCDGCKQTWGTREQIIGKAKKRMEQLYESRKASKQTSEQLPNVSAQKISRRPVTSADLQSDAARARASSCALQALLMTSSGGK